MKLIRSQHYSTDTFETIDIFPGLSESIVLFHDPAKESRGYIVVTTVVKRKIVLLRKNGRV